MVCLFREMGGSAGAGAGAAVVAGDGDRGGGWVVSGIDIVCVSVVILYDCRQVLISKLTKLRGCKGKKGEEKEGNREEKSDGDSERGITEMIVVYPTLRLIDADSFYGA